MPLAGVGPGTGDGPVTPTHPGKKPATIRVNRDGNQIAAIPAARHHAVLTMIDSGLDLTHHLGTGQLVTTMAMAGLNTEGWPTPSGFAPDDLLFRVVSRAVDSSIGVQAPEDAACGEV